MEIQRKDFFIRHFGLRGVATFEAGKGALALLAAGWVLTLRHKNMEDVAERLMSGLQRVLHINPDRHFFQWMMRSVGGVTPHGLRVVALLIALYGMIRFVEASGLWLEKEWAEWFALISGAIYTPYLIYQLARHPNGIKWAALILNLIVVGYMGWLIRDSHRRRQAVREARSAERPLPY